MLEFFFVVRNVCKGISRIKLKVKSIFGLNFLKNLQVISLEKKKLEFHMFCQKKIKGISSLKLKVSSIYGENGGKSG